MEETFARIIDNLIDRVSGPMHLRLILQPAMATIFAIIAGLKDAREGKPLYFWALFTEPEHRRDWLKDGWKSVGKVLVAALVLDIVYQIIQQRWVYPLEVVIVAIILAIIPYLLFRGLINRIASKRR